MRTVLIFFIAIYQCFTLYGQDVLVLKTGQRISFSKMDLREDSIDIVTHEEKVDLSFSSEAVLGYCSPVKEENYYVKPNPEFYGGQSYQFIERVGTGKINLYKKMSSAGDLSFYMEKGNRFENTYDAIATGKRKKEKFDQFSTFIDDDKVSVKFINAPGFKFKIKDVVRVVQYYNRRNFNPKVIKKTDPVGSIFLYRTKFQKVKRDLNISFLDKSYDLKVNDFIQLNLPIEYATELTISGEYVKNKKLLAADLIAQYFEIVYDQKAKRFVLEKKEGSERQYEFYKIKNATED